jgi:hypothetical protein
MDAVSRFFAQNTVSNRSVKNSWAFGAYESYFIPVLLYPV